MTRRQTHRGAPRRSSIFHQTNNLQLLSTRDLISRYNLYMNKFCQNWGDSVILTGRKDWIEVVRFNMDSVVFFRNDSEIHDPRYNILMEGLLYNYNCENNIPLGHHIMKALKLITKKFLNVYYLDDVYLTNNYGWCFEDGNSVIKIWDYYD